MPMCYFCERNRSKDGTLALPVQILLAGRDTHEMVILCAGCIARRNLFCTEHGAPKLCFAEHGKDAPGKMDILGVCTECALSELEVMDDGRRAYLVGRFWQKDPVKADAISQKGATGPRDVFLDGDDAVAFALLCIAQMRGVTPDAMLEHNAGGRLLN